VYIRRRIDECVGEGSVVQRRTVGGPGVEVGCCRLKGGRQEGGEVWGRVVGLDG
jgi:hypothetical protein